MEPRGSALLSELELEGGKRPAPGAVQTSTVGEGFEHPMAGGVGACILWPLGHPFWPCSNQQLPYPFCPSPRWVRAEQESGVSPGSKVPHQCVSPQGREWSWGASSCSSQPVTRESAPSSGSLIQISRWACWGPEAGSAEWRGLCCVTLGVPALRLLSSSETGGRVQMVFSP